MSMAFPSIIPLFNMTGLNRIAAPAAGALAMVMLSAMAFQPSHAASNDSDVPAALSITIDRAKVVRIAKPADTIIVGNPSIVDATIQDSRTIVLTGRNFGVTNMIILDSDGDPIVDETIVVKGHETNTVRIYRQSIRETLACSPVCENTLTIGDESTMFANIEAQIKSRNGLAEDAAENK